MQRTPLFHFAISWDPRVLFQCILTNIKFEFSRHIFEKFPNIKFHISPVTGSHVFRCGRTDIPDETNSHFRNFAHIKVSLVQWLVAWISRKNAADAVAPVN